MFTSGASTAGKQKSQKLPKLESPWQQQTPNFVKPSAKQTELKSSIKSGSSKLIFKDFTSATKPSEPKIKEIKTTAHYMKKILEVPDTQLQQSVKGD